MADYIQNESMNRSARSKINGYIFQHTPYNINRFVIFIAYAILLSCSSTYYAWSRFMDYLILGGKYEWLCTKEELKLNFDDNFKCHLQKEYLFRGYSWIKAVDYLISPLSSLLSDNFNHKFVILAGLIFSILGWVGLSKAEGDYMMYFSFIMIGLASSCLYSPTLIVINLFPEYPSISLSVLIAFGESASRSIPFIMHYLIKYLGGDKESFVLVTHCYIYSVLLVCIIIAFICVPSSPFQDQYDLKDVSNRTQPLDQSVITLSNTNANGFLRKFTSFYAKDTTNNSLTQALLGGKLYLCAASLAISSICLRFFSYYFDLTYEHDNDVRDFCSLFEFLFILSGIPLGYLHDNGYSHYILLICQLFATISSILLKLYPTRIVGYIVSILSGPFIALQESALVIYVENNYRVALISTLSSILYFVGGSTELISVIIETRFHFDWGSFTGVIVTMLINLFLLIGLMFMYKKTDNRYRLLGASFIDKGEYDTHVCNLDTPEYLTTASINV